MSFLSLPAALIAAALTIPPLVALYVLRLRRRMMRVSSTMFWPGIGRDLQVNTPFQRLRSNWLLWLQLFALLGLLIAFAAPISPDDSVGRGRTILILDCGASMRALSAMPGEEIDPAAQTQSVLRSRFDVALERAHELVDERTRRRGIGGTRGEVMIIAAGRRPRIVSGYETRAAALHQILDSVSLTDEVTDLESALRLAEPFARVPSDDGAGPERSDASSLPELIFLSDGGVAAPEDPAGFQIAGASFAWESVAEDSGAGLGNVGLVTLNARRQFADPGTLRVLVQIQSTAPEPRDVLLECTWRGSTVRRELVELEACAPDDPPVLATMSFDVDAPQDGIFVGRLRTPDEDRFRTDDAVALVVPAPAAPAIVLVTGAVEPDPLLEDLLREFRPRSFDALSPAEFRTRLEREPDAFDLAFFDRVENVELPPIPSVWFGGRPRGIERSDEVTATRIQSWDRRDPLLRHVGLDRIAVAASRAWVAPTDAKVLATGNRGPLILDLRAANQHHVLIGFDLTQTNWAADVGIAVFTQNVIERLAATGVGITIEAAEPGAPLTVRPAAGATEISLRRLGESSPDGSDGPVVGDAGDRPTLPELADGTDDGGRDSADSDRRPAPAPPESPITRPVDAAGRVVVLPGPVRTGLYEAEGAVPGDRVISVALQSERESDLRIPERLDVAASEPGTGGAGTESGVDRRHWFLVLALAILIIEWTLYCRRLRGGP